MALFGKQNGSNSNRGNNADDRVPAQVWLNVGVTLPVEQEDGSMKDMFIGLPVGIPLDTTDPMPARGSNTGWHEIVAVKNALLAFAQKVGADLKPGEGELIEDFQVQVFRRNEASDKATSRTENPLLAALNERGFKVG